jgi:anti-sigma B factor antagonist
MEALRIEKAEVQEKGVVVLYLHGALGPNTAPQFTDVLQDLFDKKMYKIVLDLNDVDYISSAGVGALISGLERAQLNHGDMVVIHPKPTVLELFGLSDMFHFAADAAAATALF